MTELVDTWLHYQGRPMFGRTSRSGPHPDRPTIVLLHGLVVSGRYLVPLAEALTGSFDVHVPDLPGFGRSPGPKQAQTIADLADAVVGWLDAAHLPDAVLISNSFGCRIALEVAARHADRVAAMVMQSPTVDARARSPMGILRRLGRDAVHEPASLLPLVLADYLKTDKRYALETLRVILSDPIEEKLSQVFARTLIVSGERDPVAPPDWCRRLALELPDGEHVVIEGGSHALVYNEPRSMARLIRHFALGERFASHPTVHLLLEDPPAPDFLANLDSAATMVRAGRRALLEEGFEGSDLPPPEPRRSLIGRLHLRHRERPGIRPREMTGISTDAFRKWVVDSYPSRTQSAVFIGSTSGAISHLAAAMGVAWLPQTFLVQVQRGRSNPSDLVAEMEWGRRVAAPVLSANGDLSLVHAHDPIDVGADAGRVSSFRLKLRELGTVYRTFIHRYLETGGTIYVVDCAKRWPQVKLSDRHAFQPGGPAGLSPEELIQPSPRALELLKRLPAKAGRFRAPSPDESGPEAEWGFEPAILDEVTELAERRQYRVVRIRYDDPDDLSPMVADVISDWYRDMGFRDHHLLVSNGLQMDPWWTIRTCSVPFWTALPGGEAVDRVRAYLARSTRWRSVDLMLGPDAADPGEGELQRWQEVVRRAGTGSILGVDAGDSTALRRQVARREWPLHPLEPARLDRWLLDKADFFHAEELTVPARDARTPVTLRPASPRPISVPGW